MSYEDVTKLVVAVVVIVNDVVAVVDSVVPDHVVCYNVHLTL